MDVNAVLLSVQERDKWQHRLRLLEGSLGEIRERRKRLVQRLRKIKRDLARLGDYSDAILDATRRHRVGGPIHAADTGRLPSR
ncbi:MAG: hypothetical protein L3K17_08075 [Thermoplasmata archaeon]|nr:hypothetical protein [Thermoplasmata archaeon]